MKRAIATFTLTLISIAALGLTGCSGTSDPVPEPTTVTTTETVTATSEPAVVEVVEEEAVEEKTPAADLSLVNACMSLAEPLQKANLAMLEIAEKTTTDPQSAVDAWRALSVAFADFGGTAANPEVAALSAAVGENGHALTDVMQRVYVNEDFSALGDFTEANDAFFKAYQEMLNLCGTAG